MPPRIRRLLVANRGEIAIRVMATAADMGIETVAVFPDDDATSLHARRADDCVVLERTGVAAYLDVDGIVAAATRSGCDAIHPGYGFLSENAAFAARCADAGIVFVGPTPHSLATFGDKVQARAMAKAHDVPVARSLDGVVGAASTAAFLESLGPGAAIAIKAVAGGGGRGIRIVRDAAQVADALQRCASEAKSAFGSAEVFVEAFIPRARHIEIQVLGDGAGDVLVLGDRDCSVQRLRQKLVEVAPAPNLATPLRDAMAAAALRMARAAEYRSLGTFEFLVREGATGETSEPGFVFLEANPRIQVEHTVTEEVTGLDLVRLQLEVACGKRLGELGLGNVESRGFAIQARVNAEHMAGDGTVQPARGRLVVFEPPSGSGIRVDSAAYAGYAPNARYDSLIAKVIVHSRTGPFSAAVAKASRALRSLKIDGIESNTALLLAVLQEPAFAAGSFDTEFLERHADRLLRASDSRRLFFDSAPSRPIDPERVPVPQLPEGTEAVVSPVQGLVVKVLAVPGQGIAKGQPLLVVEAMKMENEVAAPFSGFVRAVLVEEGDSVLAGAPVLAVERAGHDVEFDDGRAQDDPAAIRPDLAEVLERRALWEDAARPDMVARRHGKQQRTTGENVYDLLDDGSFHEYHGFVIAAQRARRSLDDLIRNTPADGQVCGVGRINGAEFGNVRTQCAVLAYDYSVFAGTQGHNNHLKTDRMLEVAATSAIPVVFFAEGGGGRPGDTEGSWMAQRTFNLLPKLSGKVPTIGIASGYCFAGNAAIMGLCDVTIATRKTFIGMGGPVMIEAGGLGRYRPDQVGPAEEQVRSGVIDLLVDDERAAVAAAKKFISYWQGSLKHWTCADPTHLRAAVPQDRRRGYDVRRLIALLADADSVLELRRGFGNGMVTAFARIEGRPVAVMANDPQHLAGAIDSEAADKAARFMQLCDFYGLPLLSLVDTPGIMVGPEAERTGIVRHGSRLLAVGANLRIPHFVVVTRKAYGLGKVGMTAGAFRAATFAVSWPTAEFGPMSLEGSVRLSHRKELAAIADPAERQAEYERLVAAAYDEGKALSRAMDLETDDVIDPASTRSWIVMGLNATANRPAVPRERSFVDTW